MTAPPHDAFFKAAFEHPEHAGALVRHMLSNLDTRPLVGSIDWDALKPDSTSFVDPELERNYTDLLFSVHIAGAPGYIYFLLEHQSTTDHDMPYRMLDYLMRIWARHRAGQRGYRRKPLRSAIPVIAIPVILAIVISNVPGGWDGPLSFHDQCEPHPSSIPGLEQFVPQFQLLLLDLSNASNDEIKSWALAAFPKAALFALRDIRDHRKLLQDFEHWVVFAADAAQAPSGFEALRQLMRYIAQASPDLNIEDFRAKIRQYLPQAESELMTIYEQALQQGRKQGCEEGREEGRRAALSQLLALKFGELPPECATRLQAARPEELDRYFERILTADSLSAVFGESV